MRPLGHLLVLLVGLWAVAQAAPALAQQRTAPAKKPVYDQYEPSRILRTGRQGCMHNEDTIGAYCVKVCKKGYVPVPNSDPPRCRSLEPLPPGQLAGPIRKETGSLPARAAPSTSQKPHVPSGGH